MMMELVILIITITITFLIVINYNNNKLIMIIHSPKKRLPCERNQFIWVRLHAKPIVMRKTRSPNGGTPKLVVETPASLQHIVLSTPRTHAQGIQARLNGYKNTWEIFQRGPQIHALCSSCLTGFGPIAVPQRCRVPPSAGGSTKQQHVCQP